VRALLPRGAHAAPVAPPDRPGRGARARSEEHDEAEAGPGSAAAAQQDFGPPNKILFVQGLPEATTSSMLAMLFQQFPGCAPALHVFACAFESLARSPRKCSA
jgi:hypothetical protein